jgi:hypothetical protein
MYQILLQQKVMHSPSGLNQTKSFVPLTLFARWINMLITRILSNTLNMYILPYFIELGGQIAKLQEEKTNHLKKSRQPNQLKCRNTSSRV